jgi:hypothetical protein
VDFSGTQYGRGNLEGGELYAAGRILDPAVVSVRFVVGGRSVKASVRDGAFAARLFPSDQWRPAQGASRLDCYGQNGVLVGAVPL